MFRRGKAAVHSDEMLRAVVQASLDGVLVTDQSGVIGLANPAAGRMFGADPARLIGRDIATVLGARSPPPAATAGGEPWPQRPVELAVQRGDGSTVHLELVVGTALPPRSRWTMRRRQAPREIRVHTFRDVSERHRSDAARRAALAEARVAAAAKSEFLRNMGHELRTPLNSVIGFSEILKDELIGPIGNEQHREYIQAIHTCGAHLLQVINEILDVSRIEAGEYELDESPIDLAELVEDAVAAAAGLAEADSIDIVARLPDEPPILMGDDRLVRQAVRDLLSNAVKFSPQGGEIEASVVRDPAGALSVSIRDHGIGINADQIDRVTEPFYQVDSALDRKYEGAGLGLYLARAFVEFHGGTLAITSALGEGTTVTLRFPSSRSVAAAETPPVAAVSGRATKPDNPTGSAFPRRALR